MKRFVEGEDRTQGVFRLRTLEKVRTEMSLHVLAYNLKRMIASAQEGLNRPEQQRQQHEAANVREC